MYCVWSSIREESHFCARVLILPAIQPARLKQQASLLAETFEQPEAFLRGLHSLLDSYADRVIRHGQSGKPRALTPSYNVRAPLLRHLLLEIEPHIENKPASSLVLCDALWAKNFLEFRLLATLILGKIPLTPAQPVLERVTGWIGADLEEKLTTALLTNALVRLRQEQPQNVIDLAKTWLNNASLFYQQIGLRTLPPLIQEPAFENLPSFFQLIQPFVLKVHPTLRPDLLDVLTTLARRSPGETAYFLRQSLAMPENPDTGFIIRQLLQQFPEDMRDS